MWKGETKRHHGISKNVGKFQSQFYDFAPSLVHSAMYTIIVTVYVFYAVYFLNICVHVTQTWFRSVTKTVTKFISYPTRLTFRHRVFSRCKCKHKNLNYITSELMTHVRSKKFFPFDIQSLRSPKFTLFINLLTFTGYGSEWEFRRIYSPLFYLPIRIRKPNQKKSIARFPSAQKSAINRKKSSKPENFTHNMLSQYNRKRLNASQIDIPSVWNFHFPINAVPLLLKNDARQIKFFLQRE